MRRIFAVAALFISSQSFSQDTTKMMDEVTLTATKFSVKTTQTGKVVTIITSKDIEHSGSRDLSQVITELGGVFINGYSSNPGKEKNIYIRGAKVEYTLITIDGVPVYDASGIGSYFDIRNIGIDNVERVEILKGSQSTLYGSDAIAGVINIITKKGGNASGVPSVSQVMDYGSFNTFRSGTNVTGSYKKIDYNVGFSHLNTDGISEAKQKGSDKYEKDGYTQNALNANFGIRVSDRIKVQPFLRYSVFKGDIDLDAFADEKDFTNTNKNFQTGVRNTIGLGKGQLNVLYQFVKTRRNYLNDSLYVNPLSGYYLFNQQRYNSDEHFGEAFLVYPFNSVKLTAGVDVRNSNTDYSGLQKNVFDADDTKPYADPNSYSGDSVNQNQVGAYAALNYTWKSFNVEGGGRFNHHSEYGNNFAFNFNPSYFIKNRVKVYANASSGYNVPSLYQLFSIYGNRDLKPQTSLNIEGGVQVFSANGKNSIRATYFNRNVEDVIIFFFNPVTFQSSYINQDKQKDHGVEVEGNASIANKLQLKAVYTYVTGEVTTKKGNKDTTYFNLLRRPKSTFSIFAGVQATKALYFSAQANAIGERKDIYFDPVTFQAVDIKLDSYVLLNLYAQYALSSRVNLFADVRNVLDENYMDIYGYSTTGLNAYGGIRFKF